MGYFRDNIERMQGYVPGFQPKEPGFVKLNTNENPYPPSPRVIEALKATCGAGLLKYPNPTSDPFREKAAQVLMISPDRIICGNGSDDLLSIAFQAFCGEGDTVAFPMPSYSLYPVLAEVQDARTVTPEFPDDFSLPHGLAETGARLTILCNPNAPSGTLVPREEVAALAGALNGALLVDEAYVDFSDWNCLDLVDQFDNVIVMRTLSKSYSLAGLRFGFAVAQEPMIAGLMKVKDSYPVDALALAGATAAIADQDWMLANAAKIRLTRGRLIEALDGMGFRCWPSQANFVFARVPGGRTGGGIYRALFDRKILVRYWDKPRLNDCLRITVGTDEQIDALLDALHDILAA